MARILVTGSAAGLGLLAAQLLAEQNHEVVLHARSEQRGAEARAAVPQAADVVVGDLANLSGMRRVAQAANRVGPFDAVIHNAGVGYREPRRIVTEDGLSHVFAVNVLSPYLLTTTMEMPRRLVYLSSGLHRSGSPSLEDLQWSQRRWNGSQAYSDSKLLDVVLAFAVARRRPDVLSNAIEPGWVATRMGGPGAPDDLSQGPVTQAWLATSDEPEALVSGRYFYHQQRQQTHAAAHDQNLQERLLATCAVLTGSTLSGSATSR